MWKQTGDIFTLIVDGSINEAFYTGSVNTVSRLSTRICSTLILAFMYN
jgi:hypothetical protein